MNKASKLHRIINAFWHILRSEFRTIFSDRGVLLLIVGAGIMYPLLYSWAYSNETLKDVRVALVDNDNSSYSRQLARMIDATEQVQIAAHPTDFEAAKTLFYQNEVNGVILIEKDFSQRILKSEQAAVSIYADAGYFMLYKQILTGSKLASLTFGAGIEIRRLQARGTQLEAAMNNRSPIGFESLALYNHKGGYGSYAMPAVLVLILQQTLLLAIGMVGGTQHEFRKHAMLINYGLRSGGASLLVAGRAVAYFILYLFLTAFNLLMVVRWFGFPHESEILQLFVFITPFLLASIFLSLSLANLFKHRETSIMLLLFTTIPFLFLSGLSWPKEAMPEYWHLIALAIPSTSGVQGILQLNSIGAPFWAATKHWNMLWILTAVYFLVAVLSTKARVILWNKNHSDSTAH